jgi:cobalt-zinc-cadmium efflux system membrane fusion protein
VFHAEVTLLGGALDPSTRTLKVRGVVDNSESLLKAEMLVAVEVQRPVAASVSVPAAAVLLDGEVHVVFVEERPGHYQRREVRVGAEHAGMVPVLDGVRTGEKVVTGSALLLEQMYVEGR